MKTPDELDRLLDDVLMPDHPDMFRGATLQATLLVVRSGKRRRKLAQCAALLALPSVLAGGLWLQRQLESPAPQPAGSAPGTVASTATPIIPDTSIQLISDDELLGLFPGRPLALIGPKGAQQLVFLDEPVETDGRVQ